MNERELALIIRARDEASRVVRQFGGNVQRETGRIRAAAGRMGSAVTPILRTMRFAAIGAGLAFVGFSAHAVGAASEGAEATNKASIVFEESFGRIERFAESAASEVGLTRREALGLASGIGILVNQADLGSDATAEMSENLVRLASDLGSINDLNTDVVLEKIRAGLVGEAEPLRQLGILLSDRAVREEAVRLGIASSAAAADEAAKVQARYSLILRQGDFAAGDFANTSDGLANSSRILQASVSDLTEQFGAQLLPTITMTVNELRGFLEENADDIESFIGDAGMAVAEVTGALVAGVQVALPVVRGFFEFITENEAAMVAALGAIGLAATAALGPIGVIITTVGAIAGAAVLIAGAVEQEAQAQREVAAARRESDAAANVLAEDLELLAGHEGRARTAAEDLEVAIHRMREAQQAATVDVIGASQAVQAEAADFLVLKDALGQVTEVTRGSSQAVEELADDIVGMQDAEIRATESTVEYNRVLVDRARETAGVTLEIELLMIGVSNLRGEEERLRLEREAAQDTLAGLVAGLGDARDRVEDLLQGYGLLDGGRDVWAETETAILASAAAAGLTVDEVERLIGRVRRLRDEVEPLADIPDEFGATVGGLGVDTSFVAPDAAPARAARRTPVSRGGGGQARFEVQATVQWVEALGRVADAEAEIEGAQLRVAAATELVAMRTEEFEAATAQVEAAQRRVQDVQRSIAEAQDAINARFGVGAATQELAEIRNHLAQLEREQLERANQDGRITADELAAIDEILARERDRHEGRVRLARATQDAAAAEGTLAELAAGPELEAAMALLENAQLEREAVGEQLVDAKDLLETAEAQLVEAENLLSARQDELAIVELTQRLEMDRTLELREQLRLIREIERRRRDAAAIVIPAAQPPSNRPSVGGGDGGSDGSSGPDTRRVQLMVNDQVLAETVISILARSGINNVDVGV